VRARHRCAGGRQRAAGLAQHLKVAAKALLGHQAGFLDRFTLRREVGNPRKRDDVAARLLVRLDDGREGIARILVTEDVETGTAPVSRLELIEL